MVVMNAWMIVKMNALIVILVIAQCAKINGYFWIIKSFIYIVIQNAQNIVLIVIKDNVMSVLMDII